MHYIYHIETMIINLNTNLLPDQKMDGKRIWYIRYNNGLTEEYTPMQSKK